MEGIYNLKVKGKEYSISTNELQLYKESLNLNHKFSSRISQFFLLDLYIFQNEFSISPQEIISEIEFLEGITATSKTKPHTQFNRKPLLGLWHKHFYSSQFLPTNIQNSYNRKAIANIVDDALEGSENNLVTEEIAALLSMRLTYKPLVDRIDNGKITGEWIVFAEDNGQKYYLCLATHNEPDEIIARKIRNNCIRDFDFIDKYFL